MLLCQDTCFYDLRHSVGGKNLSLLSRDVVSSQGCLVTILHGKISMPLSASELRRYLSGIDTFITS